jgi:hypothetical protein
MARMRHGSRVMRSSACQVRLSRVLARSAGARSADHPVAGLVVGGEVAAVGRDHDADALAGVALVGQGRQVPGRRPDTGPVAHVRGPR